MSHISIKTSLLRAAACFMIASAAPASAMQLAVSGDQLVLSGPVTGQEPIELDRLLTGHPGINTIVLRNSIGGEPRAGYRVGEMLRTKGLRTAVSGYCYSSCSRMFLGGTTRVFTDDFPPEYTQIGFHGHYDAHGNLDAALVRALGLKEWIIKFSDGKADPALVERWINIPVNRGMIHFFHPARLKGRGATTFFCQGHETTRAVFACEPEARTALDLGVITSLDVISSNDQAELRANGLPGAAVQH